MSVNNPADTPDALMKRNVEQFIDTCERLHMGEAVEFMVDGTPYTRAALRAADTLTTDDKRAYTVTVRLDGEGESLREVIVSDAKAEFDDVDGLQNVTTEPTPSGAGVIVLGHFNFDGL